MGASTLALGAFCIHTTQGPVPQKAILSDSLLLGPPTSIPAVRG